MLINHLIKTSAQGGPAKCVHKKNQVYLKDLDMLQPGDVAKKIVQLAAGKMNSGACIKICT